MVLETMSLMKVDDFSILGSTVLSVGLVELMVDITVVTVGFSVAFLTTSIIKPISVEILFRFSITDWRRIG